jgi:hydrogenase maturation protease
VTARIVGVGRPHRGDDAAGLLAARLVRGTEVLDGASLLDAFEGADAVVVLDAMRSGRPPGTVERFDASSAPLPAASLRPASTHAFGVAGRSSWAGRWAGCPGGSW